MSEKVIKAIKYLGSFSMKDGATLHRQGVQFEDGTKGVAFSKEQSPPYQVGQSVFITDKGKTDNETGAPNIKIDKQAPQGGGGFQQRSSGGGGGGYSKPSGDNHLGIEVGQALNKAVDCVIATSKEGINMDTFFADVKAYAQAIYVVGQQLRANPPTLDKLAADAFGDSPTQGESEEEEEIPF